MCFTNNFFEKYLNATQDEVLQSIEIIIQKMYSKLRGSASSSATLCIVSVIYLHGIWKIFYLPHIIFALLLLIFMSWGAKIWFFFTLSRCQKEGKYWNLCSYWVWRSAWWRGWSHCSSSPCPRPPCSLQTTGCSYNRLCHGVLGTGCVVSLPAGGVLSCPVPWRGRTSGPGTGTTLPLPRTLGTPGRQHSYSWWQM